MSGARGAWALAVALALAAAVVLATPVTTWRSRADEGNYLWYTARVAQDGIAALPTLVHEYLADAERRKLFAGPLRLTAVATGALAVSLTTPEFETLAHLSLAAFLVLLVVVWVAVRDGFDARTAACMVLLLACSPLHLAMARRALTDSLNATLVVGSFALFAHVLTTRPGALGWWAAVAGAYVVAFLGRELNLVLVPISCAVLALAWWLEGRRPSLTALAAVSAVPIAGAALLVVLAAGGPGAAAETLASVVGQPAQNVYATRWGQGPWFRYLLDYLAVAPWTTLLYVAWLGTLVADRSRDLRAWSWALLPIAFIGATAPVTKFVRWALPLETSMCLGAALFVRRAVGDRPGDVRATAKLVAIVGAIMAADLYAFHRLFVAYDLYDPTTASILRGWNILPR